MAKVKGNFAANGDSVDFDSPKITVLLGHTTGSKNDFGGGTVTLYVSYNSVDWTAVDTYTAETAFTTVEYNGGARFKLTLSGSTSPDLSYVVVYA
jgi:hypothetical protein